MGAGAEIQESEQSSIKAPLGSGTEKEVSSLLPWPQRLAGYDGASPSQGSCPQGLLGSPLDPAQEFQVLDLEARPVHY